MKRRGMVLACLFMIVSVMSGVIFINAVYASTGTRYTSHVVIDSYTEWTRSNSPYYIEKGVDINDGGTLAIESGVTVYMYYDYWNDNGIDVNDGGTLLVNGINNELVTAPVTFALAPDETDEHWGTISFRNGSSGHMTYAIISNGGTPGSNNYYNAAVYVDDSSPSIRNCVISDSVRHGIALLTPAEEGPEFSPIIEFNNFVNCDGYAIQIIGCKDSPIIRNNYGHDNKYDAINLDDIRLASDDYTLYDNSSNGNALPYHITGYFSIPEGTKLTVEEGSILKVAGGYISVYGGEFNLLGSSLRHIKLTSISDDSIGGDSNNDNGVGGAATVPEKGDWNGIVYNENSTGTIRYAELHYAGDMFAQDAAIYVSKCSPTITNTEISKSEGYGLIVKESDLTFTNNDINQCNDGAVKMEIVNGKTPDFTGITADDNRINGIMFTGSISGDAVLNAYGLPYVPTSTPRVEEDASLRINSGNVLKFYNHGTYSAEEKINVFGNLTVAGTVNKPVIFTTIKDDDYINDTNNDGDASRPFDEENADWQSISFYAGSRGIIDYGIFKYGGYNINSSGSQLTIRDSKFLRDECYTNYCYGIYLGAGTSANHQVSVNRCVFSNLGSAFYINGTCSDQSNFSITNSYFYGLRNYGVYSKYANNTINATNNWWGHISGPSGEGSGQGTKVSKYVNFEPYMTNNPYIYDYDFSGSTTIKDAVILREHYSDDSEDDGYDSWFDINGDGIVDILDFVMLLKRI